MNISVDGFSPENLERIYLGEPALAADGEKLPADILQDKEYEAAELVAEGLAYREVAERLGRSFGIVREHLHCTYKKLGVTTKLSLASYFPIDTDDPRLAGKTLGQFESTPRVLEVVEGLSRGKVYKAIAADMFIAESTARTQLSYATEMWPDCRETIVITRLMNAIRANYARKISEAGNEVPTHLGSFALQKLVLHEPKIRRLFNLPDLSHSAETATV